MKVDDSYQKYLELLSLGVAENDASDFVGWSPLQKSDIYSDSIKAADILKSKASFSVNLLRKINDGVEGNPRLALEFLKTMNPDVGKDPNKNKIDIIGEVTVLLDD